jgi:hypothetical protein
MPDTEAIVYRDEQFPAGWNPPSNAHALTFYDCMFATMPTTWPPFLTDLTLDTCHCDDPIQWTVPESLSCLKLGFQSLCPARIPAGLQTLYLRKFRADRLPDLPQGLKNLILLRGRMSEFPAALPPSLEYLHLYQSGWRSLPPLPGTLRTVKLEEQYLDRYPTGPPNLVVQHDDDCEFGAA